MKSIKLALLALAVFIVLNIGVNFVHAQSDVSIYIQNGKKQYFNNDGLIENGTTLVPLSVKGYF